MKTKIIYFTVLLLVSLTACDRPPRGVLSNKKMEEALFKVHLSEGIFDVSDSVRNPDLRKRYVHNALKKDGISPEKFQRSVKWYSQHPKQYEEVYKRVVERLVAMLADAEAGKLLPPKAREKAIEADTSKWYARPTKLQKEIHKWANERLVFTRDDAETVSADMVFVKLDTLSVN